MARDPADDRRRMVERQLRRRGIGDDRVLTAMAEVPREEFLPERLRPRAYADSALPIACDQTVSQPWIVARVCEALAPALSDRVLEIGTGSGYSTAVLARLAGEVISIERHRELADGARATLARLGVTNAEVLDGDGSAGRPDRAPFQAIAVHAAAPARPTALLGQLADGGRLVAPIAAEPGREMLTLYRRRGSALEAEEITPVAFVPLIGAEGYAETP